MSSRVLIRKLPSGVQGLDEVLGGGIPEFSFNLIAGGPGGGKTTMAHQIMFANATPERKAVYFSIIGEPPIKMLRYQQQYSFFDAAKVGDGSIRFINLGQQALDGGMAKVLEAIVGEIERSSPGIVVVDSFRAMARSTLAGPGGEHELTNFMQRLAAALTSYQATTFLIGEYSDGEHDSAVFTVADGLIWLYQAVDRNSVVRKLHVMKMRGQGQIPGLHTARISDAGYTVFPRLLKPAEVIAEHPLKHRLSTGVPGLDEMLGGGIPSGYSALIAGPSGSGKTVLSNQFILDGVERGENGVVAIFEKRPNDYLQTTPHGVEFERLVREKKLEVVYLRPLDLSIDETLLELQSAVKRVGAKRAVIDSLSGLELALAPTFREDFRESLYRMMGALTGLGVTVMATVELADAYTDLRFSPQGIAFLTDAIIIQRYVEIAGELRRAMAVVKVRSSQHSKELREYEISSDGGLVVKQALKGYEGLLTGASKGRAEVDDGYLTEREAPTMAKQSITVELDDATIRSLAGLGEPAAVLAQLAHAAAEGVRRPDHRQRAQTDQSLQVERDRSDTAIVKAREGIEATADEVVRTARKRADRVVQTARDDADRSTASGASSEGERARADDLLEDERSSADAVLAGERAEQRRRPAALLSGERDATDKDLTTERAQADTLIVDQREANERMVGAAVRAQELEHEAAEAKERAEERERALQVMAEFREMFIGILGHDLRNPLAAIDLSAAGLLRRGNLDGHVAKAAGRIIRSSQRMNRMIFQLLDLTRARLGDGLPIEPGPTDLREVCQNVVEEFEATIRLEVEGDVTGTWDQDRLEEVLSNLAGNAIEYAAKGTAVVVKARADGADVVVEVSNQGHPIPADVLPFIFEPFRRAQQREKSATGNLGLGLYIARQITLAHGGTLDVRSADGTTAFVMRLPRAPPPPPPPANPVG